MAGGPSSPTGRNGVEGLLIKSSISETLGRRISIDGLRLYESHTKHKLQVERCKCERKKVEKERSKDCCSFYGNIYISMLFLCKKNISKIRRRLIELSDVFTFSMNFTLELKLLISNKNQTFTCTIRKMKSFKAITQKINHAKRFDKKIHKKQELKWISVWSHWSNNSCHVFFLKSVSRVLLCVKKERNSLPTLLFDHDVYAVRR